MKKEKILIFGAGAVGAYFGLKLHKKGYETVFACRGKIYEKIKTEGIILDSFTSGKEYFKNINIINSSQTDIFKNYKEYFDVVLFCVKSYDTEKSAEQISETLKKNGVIISLQNGVENEYILSKIFGEENVPGAVVFIASSLENNNYLKHTGSGKITFGKMFKKYAEEKNFFLKKLFDDAEIDSSISENILQNLWTKLVWNASFNAVSVALSATVMEMIESENSLYLLRGAMREVILTAAAQGIKIDESIIEKFLDRNTNIGEFKTSMLQDYEKGKKLEFEYLNGAVIRFAKKYNVPVPLNESLYNILAFLDNRRNK